MQEQTQDPRLAAAVVEGKAFAEPILGEFIYGNETTRTKAKAAFDFFAGIQDYLYFPEGTREALWISDRDGYNHVYRYDYAGKLLNQVTQGPWVVTRVEGIDPRARTIFL